MSGGVKTLGERIYDVLANRGAGVNMPAWADLLPEVRARFEAAAVEVIKHTPFADNTAAKFWKAEAEELRRSGEDLMFANARLGAALVSTMDQLRGTDDADLEHFERPENLH